jgi:hypothetical protein
MVCARPGTGGLSGTRNFCRDYAHCRFPLRVISVVSVMSELCPLTPRERLNRGLRGTSVSGRLCCGSSERVFADQMPCNELRKAVGWKTDQSCDPPHYCRMNAPAPLENFVRLQKQSFATQSAISELPHCKMIGETLTCACRKHRERCSEVRALSVSFGKFRCWRCAEGADQARKVWCDDGPIEYFGCRPGRSQH